jgi:TctA family transporter
MPKDDILDLPKRKAQGRWITSFFYAAIVLFAYWFVADWLHWPLASLALILGLISFALLTVLRFRKNRKLGSYQYFYLAGHLSLLTGIGLYLLHWPVSSYFFWAAFGWFGLGLLMLSRK